MQFVNMSTIPTHATTTANANTAIIAYMMAFPLCLFSSYKEKKDMLYKEQLKPKHTKSFNKSILNVSIKAIKDFAYPL